MGNVRRAGSGLQAQEITQQENPKKKTQQTELMTEGNIGKKILLFSIPLILGNLLQQLYNTMDSIIVGNFVGSNALAAVGSSTSIINLLIAFSQGAAVGAGVIAAQYMGAKKKESVERAVHTALAMAILLGILLTLGGVLFSRALLIRMNTPEEVLVDSVDYMRLYSWGLLFNVVYNMAAGILNAAGNSRRSLIYLAYASVTNIILDLLLIAGFHMGVKGAAIATDISQMVSCVLALRFLMGVPADYRVRLKQIRIHREMAGSILKIGLPTGIQNMVISLSNVLVQSGVNGFGPKVMAGFGAYMKIDGFNILPVMSFSMAMTTFTGQNYGAGKLDRVKKGLRITTGMCMVYTLLTGMLLLLGSNAVMGLFTRDAEVIACGKLVMRYFCPFYIFLGVMHALAGAVRGTGKTMPPMVILLTSLCLLRILWMHFVLPVFPEPETVYLQYPVSWAVGMALMLLYAWKGKWLVAETRWAGEIKET